MVVADVVQGIAKPARPNSLAKIGLICVAASSIEWYDFLVYGTAAALVFPKLFFPATLSPLVAQLASFSTFSVGFIARPLGAVLFGHFGDLLGRKRALVVALVMMGLSSALIGALPPYARIGAAAPLLLVALRLCQGLAVGGQWGASALLAVENAPLTRRGLFGSLPQLGVATGMIAANLAVLTMTAAVSADAFLAWGWRVPFALSVVLIGIGLYVQTGIDETPEFRSAAEAHHKSPRPLRSPVIEVLTRYPMRVVLAAGSTMANNANFYLLTTFVIAYATGALHLPRSEILWAVLLGCLATMIPTVYAGALSDRFGRRAVFIAGGLLGVCGAFVTWRLIDTGAFALMFLGLTLGYLANIIMYAPQPALFAELFPAQFRYSGASISYQLGAILGGGVAPMIATALVQRFHASLYIAAYAALMFVVSLTSVTLLGRSSQATPE